MKRTVLVIYLYERTLNATSHFQTQISSYRRETICLCKAFGKKMNSHQNRIDTGEQFVCEICTKVYKHKDSLRYHYRTHSGDNEFTCDICTKVFKHKGSLRYHYRIHSGEKPFTCDICSKGFIIKSSLMAHLRLHTGEKPYVCSICDESFRRSDKLLQHECRVPVSACDFTIDIQYK